MKKKFTLIELIIVIVVIGILAAMALPKFTGIVRNARLSAMINDKEVLEKTMILYYQKHDKLPLLNENQELIVLNNNISLVKLVQAEEVVSKDMKTIYTSLQETLKHYNDSEENLYRIDISKVKDSLSKKLKYGTKKEDKDFYVYSTKTNNVYYYNVMINGNGEIQHNEFNTTLKKSELVNKRFSYNLNMDGSINNKKPIVELTTDLENITSTSIIKWEYKFIDEDAEPTKISFILNNIEYDSFDKIPTQLEEGEYVIKLKIQDSKGLWSDEVVKNFNIVNNLISVKLGEILVNKIDLDGNVYVFGSNNYGSLGLGPNISTIRLPQLLTFPNQVKIKDIDPSFCFSVALDYNGKVYSWGFNKYGQLGIGNNENKDTPQEVLFPQDIVIKKISTGNHHVFALTSNGDLYSWGDNEYGQLGIGSIENQNTPQKINFPNGIKIKSFEAGYYHSIAIGTDNNVYTWGHNIKRVLLTGDNINRNTPIKMQLPEGLQPVKVFAGFNISMILCDDGNLYAAGSADYGQLGIGTTSTNPHIPTKVAFQDDIKPIEVVLANQYGMAIANDGNIYSWGKNDYGQLGLGATGSSVKTPQKVTLQNGDIPKKIVAYSNTSMAICENGNVYFWGFNPNNLFDLNGNSLTSKPILQPQI